MRSMAEVTAPPIPCRRKLTRVSFPMAYHPYGQQNAQELRLATCTACHALPAQPRRDELSPFPVAMRPNDLAHLLVCGATIRVIALHHRFAPHDPCERLCSVRQAIPLLSSCPFLPFCLFECRAVAASMQRRHRQRGTSPDVLTCLRRTHQVNARKDFGLRRVPSAALCRAILTMRVGAFALPCLCCAMHYRRLCKTVQCLCHCFALHCHCVLHYAGASPCDAAAERCPAYASRCLALVRRGLALVLLRFASTSRTGALLVHDVATPCRCSAMPCHASATHSPRAAVRCTDAPSLHNALPSLLLCWAY